MDNSSPLPAPFMVEPPAASFRQGDIDCRPGSPNTQTEKMRKGRVDLSVVTPLYNTARYLPEFCERIARAARQISSSFEIIMVNDGSPDNSLAVALELQQEYPELMVVDLSRNFGEHKAVMTGFAHCRGEKIFFIHCELEEPPETLTDFHNELSRQNVDHIYGVQPGREGGFVKSFLGGLFYSIFNSLSEVELPRNGLSSHLMTRRFLDALLEYRDRDVFLGGAFHSVGFEERARLVEKKESGMSNYTLARRISMMVSALTSFSGKPLMLVAPAGLAIFGLSLLSGMACAVVSAPGWYSFPGWLWVVLSVWQAGGLVLMAVGLVAVYLLKVLTEVKDRPYTTVRKVYMAKQIESEG